jgi:hypothetical protein
MTASAGGQKTSERFGMSSSSLAGEPWPWSARALLVWPSVSPYQVVTQPRVPLCGAVTKLRAPRWDLVEDFAGSMRTATRHPISAP